MFILRQIHKESGKVTNFIIGKSYSIQKSENFFRNSRVKIENQKVLVGDCDFIHQLGSGFDYYIMTESGGTFDKIIIS